MKSNLISPISGNHSVKEVVLSLAVKPIIKNPEAYKSLIETDGALHGRFAKFELLNTTETKFDSKTLIPQVTAHYVSGFKISSFSQDGKLKDLIQCQERKNEQISFITYHTLSYVHWSGFAKDAFHALKAIGKFISGSEIVAAGLLYIDEFYVQNANYSADLIFNEEAKDLPKSLLCSDTADYQLQTNKTCRHGKYTDGLSIKVFNQKERKTIRITDNMSFVLPQQPLGMFIENAEKIGLFDVFKNENQNVLRDILSEEALICIGL